MDPVVCKQSSLEGLPVELRIQILYSLPNILSLSAAVLSCPALNLPFRPIEAAVTKHVLESEVDRDVLSEASIAVEASLSAFDTEARMGEFMAKHFQCRQGPPEKWTLAQALPIARLHNWIALFSELFFSTMSQRQLAPVRPANDISRGERCRVQRALYRLEIFRNLFGVAGIDSQTMYKFFPYFAPWENEQFGCIHDFLVDIISPAFDEVAMHDITWGNFSVEYNTGVENDYVQYLLTLGFAELHRLLSAKSFDERHAILSEGCSSLPHFRDNFAHSALVDAHEPYYAVHLWIPTPGEDPGQIKRPFYPDADSGPAAAWRWAHENDAESSDAYQAATKPLRSWGYVMWDHQRLQRCGVFGTPFDAERANEHYLKGRPKLESFSQRSESYRQRAAIYRSGGRGWFSPNDCSKIVWQYGPPLLRRSNKPRNPKSMEDARRIIQAIELPSLTNIKPIPRAPNG